MAASVEFSQVIECAGASEDCLCDLRVVAGESSLQPREDDVGEYTSVDVSLKVFLTAFLYQPCEVQLVSDAFSTQAPMDLRFAQSSLLAVQEVYSEVLKKKCTLTATEEEIQKVVDLWCEQEGVQSTCGEGKLSYRVRYTLCLLYRGTSGRLLYLEKSFEGTFATELEGAFAQRSDSVSLTGLWEYRIADKNTVEASVEEQVIRQAVELHKTTDEGTLLDHSGFCFYLRSDLVKQGLGQNPDGSFSNGSGCGNEFASERPMARKYLIDSVLYWAQEYHIDGFRFDLMGLYDVDTMNELRATLDALPGGRSILMYGEPWQGGGSQLHRYEANKANLAMLSKRIGIFCDNTRDVIKGGCFDARGPGYVEGKPGSFWDIGGAVAAWCRSDKLPAHSPSQIVSYVSAHDNFTLWDKLMLVRYARPEYTAADSAALAQNRLAAGIYLTCMGMPFMQAGEEFARTKKGQGNTYRSSPSLNRLDWKRAAQFHGLVDYYRGLLGLRAQFPRLSASDAASPAAIKFFSLEQPLVGWTLPAAPGDGAAWRALCVFYNPTEEEKRVRLPDGQWKLLSDGVSSALWKGLSRVCGGEVTLLPYSATIFGQV